MTFEEDELKLKMEEVMVGDDDNDHIDSDDDCHDDDHVGANFIMSTEREGRVGEGEQETRSQSEGGLGKVGGAQREEEQSD